MSIRFRVPAATSLLLVSVFVSGAELTTTARALADPSSLSKPLDFGTRRPVAEAGAEVDVAAKMSQKLSPAGERLGVLSTSVVPTITNIDVATVINQQSLPVAIKDGGGTIVVWEDTRGGPSDIYAQKLTQGSSLMWQTDGLPVCKADGPQRYPQAVSDGAGGVIVTWQDGRNDGGDIYAQRLGPQGNPLWGPNGIPICASVNVQQKPVIVADGLGGAYVAWQDDRTASTSSDIWVQRVNSAGTILLAECGLAVCTASGPQQGLNIVSDGLRGAVIVWQDGRPGSDGGDVRAQRIEEHGVFMWQTDGVLVCGATGIQDNPTAVSDGANGVITAWADRRSGNRDIYVQRSGATTGAPQWTTNGQMVCILPGDQGFPQMCEDGVGGAILTWQDGRPGATGLDIYAQRVSPTGVMQWTADGTGVCTAPEDQVLPVITTDPMGGAIVGWSDSRTLANGLDVYTQHLTATGTSQWTANGVQVCDAPNSQDAIRVLPDGIGGAVLYWEDLRSGASYDVYGQRVDAFGNVPDQCVVPDSLASSVPVTTSAPINWKTFHQRNFYWSAVGVRGNTGDWDVEIYDVHSIGKAAFPTCFSRPLAGSYATSGVDFVVSDGNDNVVPPGVYGARIFRYSGSGSGVMEWDGGVDEIFPNGAPVGSTVSNWTGVLDTYDVLLTAGVPYWFELNHTNPAAETRVFVYSSYGSIGTTDFKYVVPRSSFVAQNVGTYATFTSPTTDYYGVVVVNDNGLPDNYTLAVKTNVVGVGDDPARLSTHFRGASPNPSAGRVQLQFSLREPGTVSFDVVDMAGRVTARIPGQRWEAGTWNTTWDGRRQQGVEAPPGIYFVQMRVDGRRVGHSRLALIR